MSEPRPGLPGEIPVDPVDADDYRDPGEPRRGRRAVDPAPLAWLLSVQLKTVKGDPDALAEGPDAEIHLARLLGACEYAARLTGGSLARVVTPGGDDDPFGDAVRALTRDGLAAAAAVFRRASAHNRKRVLDIILDYWAMPATALRIGLDDDLIERAKARGGG